MFEVRRLLKIERQQSFTNEELKIWIDRLEEYRGACPCILFGSIRERDCRFGGNASACVMRGYCERADLFYTIKYSKRKSKKFRKGLKKILKENRR